MATESSVRVSVVYSPAARVVHEVALELPVGSSVRHAIVASRLLVDLDPAEVDALECGLWGRKTTPGHGLRDGDRIELYRPLQVDPKEARRLRFAGQGSTVAGLFRRRRPGAKPGY